MITIVFTYRNRTLDLVKNCLDSLQNQTNTMFKVVLVNYGSNTKYSHDITQLIANYSFVECINCEVVSQQLWNKSRAINIALNNCESPYFFVGDVDMIFKENFIEKLHAIKKEDEINYFQVGFLDQHESVKSKSFSDYKINFLSSSEATGMTLFPTKILKSCNGYDEFYHGWGAEDTDVHVRLNKIGYPVKFISDELLILHQWHSKSYRTKKSVEPFHSNLEKINHKYLNQLKKYSNTLANSYFKFGIVPNENTYKKLSETNDFIEISNEVNEIDAFFNGTIFNFKDTILALKIFQSKDESSSLLKIKNKIRNKHQRYYSLNDINDKLLLLIIANFRNQAYQFEFSQERNEITLKISL